MTPAVENADTKRQRRRISTAIKESMRALSVQMSLFNRQLSVHVDLRDSDLDCLDVVQRHGPLSPTALARRTGLHAATMTGILDRLEKGGWIARERDPVDRRAVSLRALRDRNPEMFRLYSGMNTSMDKVLSGYTVEQLETIADFVRRTTEAGKSATENLTAR